MYETSSNLLIEEQRLILKNLLWKHQNIFAKSKGDLGVTDVVKHLKNTGDVVPIKQAARRFPITKRQVVKDELDKMSKSDVIEPSTSP